VPNIDYNPCKRCGRYVWDQVCRCQRFEVAIPWKDSVNDVDWSEVYATEAEYAAEKYAERSDCEGDYTIIRNGEGDVWVRDSEGVVTKWHIEAESVPTYSASQRT
jgi:hypothetical protein